MPILVVLALAGFASALSVRIIDPLVPAVARDLAADPQTVALLATAFALPYAIGQPILGPLGDALGKARVVQACLVVLAVALAACALSPTLETLFVARIISGFASGGIIPLSFAIVGDRFAMVERQVALSQVLAAILFGGFAGGVLAGLVGSTLGWRAVLWSIAAAALLAFLITLSGLKPRPGAVRHPFTIAGMRAGYTEVFRNPKAVVCYAAVFIEGVLLYGMLPYLALILEERGVGSVREAGFVIAGFGLGGVVFSLAVRQILALTGGQMNMIRTGGVVVGLALLMVGFAVSWQAKAVAFIIVGIGFYMIHNSLQVQATELAPGARGAAVALHAFFFFLGHAVGPVFFGFSREAVGTEATIAASAAGLVALGFLTAHLLQRRDGPPQATPPAS